MSVSGQRLRLPITGIRGHWVGSSIADASGAAAIERNGLFVAQILTERFRVTTAISFQSA